MSPLTWIRSLARIDQLELLAQHGSIKALASHISCSESALKQVYNPAPPAKLEWEGSHEVEEHFGRHKSVRCVAYMHGVTEGHVRKVVAGFGMEIANLIDYSRGDNHNNKGRRAELEYAALRTSTTLEDLNLTKGSQADFDFLDSELGRVNVKSSKQYKWKASTRRRAPHYWKISTNGWEKADHLVVLAYDSKMTTLVGVVVLKADECGDKKTLTITSDQLEEAKCLMN